LGADFTARFAAVFFVVVGVSFPIIFGFE
jgi:hypothetical protein